MRVAPLMKEGAPVLPKCRVARDFFTRFLGLMGRSRIAADEALLFPRCNSIHTFFMRFPIDVVMLGKQGDVVEIIPALKPWRMLLPRRNVSHVIEMAPGRCEQLGIRRGNQLHCEGAWE